MKTKLLATVFICLGISSLNAADTDRTDLKPQLEQHAGGLNIEAPYSVDLVAMNVRVYTSDGDLILNYRSLGETVEIPTAELTDGEYRYEAVSIIATDDTEEPEVAKRNFGSFEIKGGEIQPQKTPLDDQLGQTLQKNLGGLLSSLIPTAHADVFSTVEVESATPFIDFDDTDDAGSQWAISGYLESFGVFDYANGQFTLNIVRNANNSNSLIVNTVGDMMLANNAVTIDRSTNHVGIGTTTPDYELDIHDTVPEIELEDESDSSIIHFEYNSPFFAIEGNSQQDILSFNATAPEHSLFIDDTGRVGLGTNSPATALEIERSDGTAKFKVNETSAVAAPRTLFELSNPGNTKFSLTNTDAEVEWAFANPGSGFRVSRQGSGVVEFDLLNNGNLTIAGTLTENSDRNAKTNIVDIDPRSVLQKVSKLPIKQWQYKDALGENHIGPMAQDFYAAFGLGGTNKGIATLDTAGIALAAIQALAKQNQQILEENRALKAEVALLKTQSQRLQQLELVVAELQRERAKPLLTSR